MRFILSKKMKNRVLCRTILYYSRGITILIYIIYIWCKTSVLMKLNEYLAPIQSLTPPLMAEELFLLSNLDLMTSVSGLPLHFPTSRRSHSRYGLLIINMWLSIYCHPNPNKGGKIRQTISKQHPKYLIFSPFFMYRYKTNNLG